MLVWIRIWIRPWASMKEHCTPEGHQHGCSKSESDTEGRNKGTASGEHVSPISDSGTSTYPQFVVHYVAEVCVIVVNIVNSFEDIQHILLPLFIQCATDTGFLCNIWVFSGFMAWVQEQDKGVQKKQCTAQCFIHYLLIYKDADSAEQRTQDLWEASTATMHIYCWTRLATPSKWAQLFLPPCFLLASSFASVHLSSHFLLFRIPATSPVLSTQSLFTTLDLLLSLPI